MCVCGFVFCFIFSPSVLRFISHMKVSCFELGDLSPVFSPFSSTLWESVTIWGRIKDQNLEFSHTQKTVILHLTLHSLQVLACVITKPPIIYYYLIRGVHTNMGESDI